MSWHLDLFPPFRGPFQDVQTCSDGFGGFNSTFMLKRTWTYCLEVQICRGRHWRAWERTNCWHNVSLRDKVSEVPRRSEDTCISLPSFFLSLSPLHLIAFSSFFLSLSTPHPHPLSSESSAVALLTLIPRSSLLTCLSDCVFVCV